MHKTKHTKEKNIILECFHHLHVVTRGGKSVDVYKAGLLHLGRLNLDA